MRAPGESALSKHRKRVRAQPRDATSKRFLSYADLQAKLAALEPRAGPDDVDVIRALNEGSKDDTMGMHSLRTLNEGELVNDEVINGMGKLIEARGRDAHRRPYVFVHSFIDMLSRDGFASVKRWTARGLGKADLYARRAVFFPVNVDDEHWILIVADMDARTLTSYDSLGREHSTRLGLIERYLVDEYADKRRGEALPWTWTLVNAMKTTPQQRNAVDCGLPCSTCSTARLNATSSPTLGFRNRTCRAFDSRPLRDLVRGHV